MLALLQVEEGADLAVFPSVSPHHCGCALEHLHVPLTRALHLPSLGISGMVQPSIPSTLHPGVVVIFYLPREQWCVEETLVVIWHGPWSPSQVPLYSTRHFHGHLLPDSPQAAGQRVLDSLYQMQLHSACVLRVMYFPFAPACCCNCGKIWAFILLAVVGGWVASVFTAFNTWVCLLRKKWSKFFSARILEVGWEVLPKLKSGGSSPWQLHCMLDGLDNLERHTPCMYDRCSMHGPSLRYGEAAGGHSGMPIRRMNSH